MKEFYNKVLEMKDIEPHNSKKISRVCQDIFRYLSSAKFDIVLYVDGEVFSSGFVPLSSKIFGYRNYICKY